jgi:hypothetical protein
VAGKSTMVIPNCNESLFPDPPCNSGRINISHCRCLRVFFICCLGRIAGRYKTRLLIRDNKLFLFGRLTPTPISISLAEIQSIERQSEFPVWRVPPLNFLMKDGRKFVYSTGGNEGRMKRIMKFIEAETAMKIIKT